MAKSNVVTITVSGGQPLTTIDGQAPYIDLYVSPFRTTLSQNGQPVLFTLSGLTNLPPGTVLKGFAYEDNWGNVYQLPGASAVVAATSDVYQDSFSTTATITFPATSDVDVPWTFYILFEGVLSDYVTVTQNWVSPKLGIL